MGTKKFSYKFPGVRKDLDSKCYWTSEQQYWKLRDNSTGIQNSKGKLLF